MNIESENFQVWFSTQFSIKKISEPAKRSENNRKNGRSYNK